MNVLRIVVNELPESCRACKLHTVIPANFNVQLACFITGTINRTPNTRPTWCPLVVEVPEVCEWKKHELIAPLYSDETSFSFYEACVDDYNTNIVEDWKFCPSCGKPIKYIESE